jgi:beta-lactamase class D
VFWLLILALLLPAAAQDFNLCFGEEHATGCMAIYDDAHGWREYHPELTKQRFVPASTFKIPNTLIGLETGKLPMNLKWDGVEREIKAWNQDMDLTRAFRTSAAWYYQEMARRVGLKLEKSWVMKLSYGNMELGSKVDQFWLDGPLKISPREQVIFLQRLHDGRLPVKDSSRKAVIELMNLGVDSLYAKTGWARTPSMHYGWFVGWVERSEGPVYFALLVTEAPPVRGDFYELRIRLARKILKSAGAL